MVYYFTQPANEPVGRRDSNLSTLFVRQNQDNPKNVLKPNHVICELMRIN